MPKSPLHNTMSSGSKWERKSILTQKDLVANYQQKQHSNPNLTTIFPMLTSRGSKQGEGAQYRAARKMWLRDAEHSGSGSFNDNDDDPNPSDLPDLFKEDDSAALIHPRPSFTLASVKALIISKLPILHWARNYDAKRTLLSDVTAGLVIGFMLIPQGMAYGMLAGLPVEYGLHASIFPQLVYMALGTATHLSIGTNAPISILVASSIRMALPGIKTTCADSVESDDCHAIINATLVMGFLSGMFYFAFFLLRFSVITSLVSDPALSGFTTGATIIIITSNMKHALGISVTGNSIFETWGSIFRNLHEINWVAFFIFLVCFAFILGMKGANKKIAARIGFPIPEQLVVVLMSTALVYFGNLDVPTVGEIPSGLYTPRLPSVSGETFIALVQPALICAIVTYILTVNVAKALGDKLGYEVDPDQEFIAAAACSIVGGITGSYLPSASFSRSALIGELTPTGTALHNAVSAMVVISVLLFLTPLMFYMPKAIMASIIFAALQSMMNYSQARLLWKVSTEDFSLWFVAFIATGFLDVTWGIGISILASVVLLVKHAARPDTALLGRLPSTNLYVDLNEFPDAQEIPGVKIFLYEATLHFANKDHFEKELKRITENERGEEPLSAIIIDCSAINCIDTTCVKLLKRSSAKWKEAGVLMLFANWKCANIKLMLDTLGLYKDLNESHFFLTLHDAVAEAEKYRDAKKREKESAENADIEGAAEGGLFHENNI